ncbi:MAG: hypothetical protein U5K54_17670 [Cytophagales bacterium]|nr:hypothetical protein [Cytophagales bacterium]
MPAKFILIWDYDTPIARITTTRPYDYDFKKCLEEAKNIDTILGYGNEENNTDVTFAVVGFGAEESVENTYDVRNIIQKIAKQGHEISLSLMEAWNGFLISPSFKLKKSLERSKFMLEKCLGQKGSIKKGLCAHPTTGQRAGPLNSHLV